MRNLLTSILTAAGLLAVAFSVHAAEITLESGEVDEEVAQELGIRVEPTSIIVIEGDIEGGDYENLVRLAGHAISQGKPFAIRVDSAGSDYVEAMRLGRFLRKMMSKILVYGTDGFVDPTRCHDAAILLLVGAPLREYGIDYDKERDQFVPSVGLRRPYLRETLDAENANEGQKFRDLAKKVSDYLIEMGAPRDFIDRMYRATSLDTLDLVLVSDILEGAREKRATGGDNQLSDTVSLEKAIDEYLPKLEPSYRELTDPPCPEWLTDKELVDLFERNGSENYLRSLADKYEAYTVCANQYLAQLQREAYRKMLEEQGIDFDRRMKELAAEFIEQQP